MSTIFIAALLLICTIGIPILFVSLRKRNVRKRNEERLNLFRHSGAKYGLSFSRQEILHNKITGLDEVNKTFLIYDFKNEDNVILINLVKVRTCALVKNYENINMGNDKKVKKERHLASIDIIFEFRNSGDKPVSISFYDSWVDNIYELTDLESKASYWEAILSKIAINKFGATA